MPLHVVLVEPEIPPNTGNVIRLCANTGARLHLVRPLGFRLDAKAVRRAGLDYHELADVTVHDGFAACLAHFPGRPRWFAFSTRGSLRHDGVEWQADDVLVFGPETRGLSQEILEACPPERRVRIPMRPAARSLNLSNTAAVAVYEAWRQLGYPGAGPG
jgi:tRNA (cytidine/uridine-2'-O-)-methyltransferase